MAKGMFTQGVAILFSRAPSLESLAALFPKNAPLESHPGSDSWALSGPSFLLPLDGKSRGKISIDVVSQRWPDDMGDPKKSPELFAAWSMGHFGPYTYPGNLERAQQQKWACPNATELVAQHRAFVRIRTSYAFGAAPDDPVVPENYDPVAELERVTDVAATIIKHADAIAYFNPAGELLCDRKKLIDALAFNRKHEQAPLELWTNIRMWNPGEGRSLMDTVGMHQLDQMDVEALFPLENIAPNDVASFLRSLSFYLINEQPEFDDGNTTDGPGGVWTVELLEEPAMDPPRDVLRWEPEA